MNQKEKDILLEQIRTLTHDLVSLLDKLEAIIQNHEVDKETEKKIVEWESREKRTMIQLLEMFNDDISLRMLGYNPAKVECAGGDS